MFMVIIPTNMGRTEIFISTAMSELLPTPRCDGHVHTRLCHHAVGEMEEYVLAAIAKGITEIIFLEHFETHISYFEKTWLSQDDFSYYQQEGERLQEVYGAQITVGVGVEVGLNVARLKETADFIASYPWARIGLSYHFLSHGKQHVNMVSRKEQNVLQLAAIGHDVVLRRYLYGLLQGIEALDVGVICHLDAALRFSANVRWQGQHEELLTAILTAMARRGIALEINTSGLAMGRDVFPVATIRQQAWQFAIPFVYGSDAHKPEDVGRYFAQLPILLASN